MALERIENEMNDGWTLVELKELVEDPQKDIVDGPFGSNLKANEYIDMGVPVFKIQNIKANQFIDKNINYISEEKAKELSRHSFKSGDLIITKLGNPLGLCCKVPDKYPYGVIVADLIRFRPSTKKIIDKYLIYAINSIVIQNQFRAFTKGTTRPRVNLTIVRSIKLAFAPLPEQHRIVAKIEQLFSDLDNGIANLKNAQKQLKIYRQAVLKKAFEGELTRKWREEQTDLLSAEELLQQIKEEREKHYQKQLDEWKKAVKEWEDKGKAGKKQSRPKKPKELPPLSDEGLKELPKLPEGWCWVKVDKLLEHDQYSIKAGPFGSALKKQFYVKSGYKIYGQEQVISGNPYFGDYYIDNNKYNELISCAIKPQDILISLVGTVGKVLILPDNIEHGIINPRLIKISLNESCYKTIFVSSPN